MKIRGKVRVANYGFAKKEVFVRWTASNWLTYEDFAVLPLRILPLFHIHPLVLIPLLEASTTPSNLLKVKGRVRCLGTTEDTMILYHS